MIKPVDNLKARDEAVIMQTYGRYPLAVKRASGTRLYDFDGREYIDFLSGIAVNSLGHSPLELGSVITEQAADLIHVSNLFYQEEQVVLAEKLIATCGADKVFFCNSGAEANEAAIKLARRYQQVVRGRDAYEIVTLENSFHGRTLACLSATGQPKFREGFGPMPEGFVNVAFADLQAMDAAIGDKTAAVLLELVQGETGVNILPRDYVRSLADLCRQRGALLILDEIQTGMCRSGTFWAHEQYDVTPDIFTTAKALGNGLPIGALLAVNEVAKGFEPGTHGTTFGGNALVCAVAAAVVDIMRERDMAAGAKEMGDYAMQQFTALKGAHPNKISEVRGMGLLLAIELSFPGQDVWKKLLSKGMVCNLTMGNVLRLLPPLVIEREDLDAFVAALDGILRQVDSA